jgi:bacterioferritin
MTNQLKLDLDAIRRRAREHMKEGAVTVANTADRKQLIAVLNDALATEIVCVLRYKSHAFAAKGPRGEVVRQEMLEHAAEEQQHADQLADRIDALGGVPELNPVGIAPRAHTEYRSGESLKQNLIEDLVAERIAIETYTEIIRWIGDRDPTTRRVFEDILAKEEEHADDISRLLTHLE